MLVRIKIEPATWVNWNNIASVVLIAEESGDHWFDFYTVNGNRFVSDGFPDEESAMSWMLTMQEAVAMGNGG